MEVVEYKGSHSHMWLLPKSPPASACHPRAGAVSFRMAIAELRSALFLLWVESSLFCLKPRNQFPDPINGQLVVDRRGDPSVVLDLVVEFFACDTFPVRVRAGWLVSRP
jgi:hypothetical protein